VHDLAGSRFFKAQDDARGGRFAAAAFACQGEISAGLMSKEILSTAVILTFEIIFPWENFFVRPRLQAAFAYSFSPTYQQAAL
jgi:hypothetical protein